MDQQQPQQQQQNDHPLIFLPYDKWSPRYESQFYTIKMERYYIIRDPSDWPASTMSGTSTTATTTSDDENEDMNSSTITCQFCSRCRGGGVMNNNTRKKTKYPAVYYEIEILYGSGGGGGGTNNSNSSITNNTTKVYRRYSQFDTLLKQLDPYPYKYQYRNKYNFPPKTYMLDSWRSTDVLDERMVGLYNFLCNILSVVKQQQQQECNTNTNNSSGRLIGNFLEF